MVSYEVFCTPQLERATRIELAFSAWEAKGRLKLRWAKVLIRLEKSLTRFWCRQAWASNGRC